MTKLASKLLIGLSLFALGSAPAFAGQRKLNFFEQLFGVRHQQQAQPSYAADPQPQWWQQDQQQQGNGLYGKRHRAKSAVADAQPVESADPEFQLPGLGMGTVVYMPPVVGPVFDATFANVQVQGPEAEAIRNLLADKTTSVRAVEAERKALLGFYKANGFKPLWMESGHLGTKGADVLKVLSAAPEEGMLAKNYLPEVLPSYNDAETAVANDGVKQAKLDVELTLAALHYARHLSGGQFEPNRLSLYNDIKPDPVNADEALKFIASSEIPASYLRSVAPKHPQYALLRAELGKMSVGDAAFVAIASGPAVKPGKSDARLPQVRERLQTLGFIGKADQPAADPQKLDQDLVIGLMALQTANKLKPTGTFDSATLKLLNRDETGEHRQRLISSLERLRWLPKSLGERYVFVNQPAFTVNVLDKGQSIWKSKVIVGQPTKQTYSFYDQIQTVVFNPKWGVPASIIINEFGPKMRKDSSYLDRNGFIVVDLKGDEIGSDAVDWYHISPSPNFGVQQLAGGDNALGELKFLFPNAHDIYMHDTPTKNLFNDPVRDFSHGCVRVQNPREFAQVLLGWNKEQVVSGLAIKDTHPVALPQKVPVYLTYFTAWADESGKVQYYNDIYERDTAIAKALNYDPAAKVPGTSGNVLADGTVKSGMGQN